MALIQSLTMNRFFLIFVILVTCLLFAKEISNQKVENIPMLRADKMMAEYLNQFENIFIHNCKNNGLSSEGASKLQNTFKELEQCYLNATNSIFYKAGFSKKIENCSTDAISQTKNCLSAKQKYLPKMTLAFAKAMINLFFDVDRKNTEGAVDVLYCLSAFQKEESLIFFTDCLSTVIDLKNEAKIIPNSKTEFCGMFLPASYCFPKTLKHKCKVTFTVTEFIDEYTSAMDQLCKKEEV